MGRTVHVPVFSSAETARGQLAAAVQRIQLSDLLISWISTRDRLVCGRLAINSILPQELKVFTDGTSALTWEVLSPDVSSDVKDLQKKLKENKYVSSTSVSPVAGVIGLIVEGACILELTPVPNEVYKGLKQRAMTGDTDLKVAPIDYLRMVILYDLSRPDRSKEWSTMFDLMVRLDRAFGTGDGECYTDAVPETNNRVVVILQQARKWLLAQPHVMCGYAAAAMALNEGKLAPDARLDPDSTCMDVLALDPAKAAHEFIDALKAHVQTQVTAVMTRATAVFPRHAIVSVEGVPVIGFYHADQCTAFVKVDGLRVATIDVILAMYLRSFLAGKPTANMRCMCDMLTRQQYMRFDSPKPSFQRFVTQCYGEREL